MQYALVDLSHLLNRCRRAIQGDAYTKAGLTLQILFRSLRKLVRQQAIDHVVFAVDAGSWRNAIYPAYKAHRRLAAAKQRASEQEDHAVFADLRAALVAYLQADTRCTVLLQPGLEADDLVARWIQCHPADAHVIVSGDSDFVQLLTAKVRIFDGVQDRMLSIAGVCNGQGVPLSFTVQPKDGKIKVGRPDAEFIPEPLWWRKALFIKLIRGDSGDNIFAAYPGVRYHGSTRREGIAQAWADRIEQGYHWNNFFQQEWQKLDGMDAAGAPIRRTVRVLDEYRINQQLIDLTAQPEAIKQRLDQVIAAACQAKRVSQVGLRFLQFCGAHDLPALAEEASDHARYLNAGYRSATAPDANPAEAIAGEASEGTVIEGKLIGRGGHDG